MEGRSGLSAVAADRPRAMSPLCLHERRFGMQRVSRNGRATIAPRLRRMTFPSAAAAQLPASIKSISFLSSSLTKLERSTPYLRCDGGKIRLYLGFQIHRQFEHGVGFIEFAAHALGEIDFVWHVVVGAGSSLLRCTLRAEMMRIRTSKVSVVWYVCATANKFPICVRKNNEPKSAMHHYPKSIMEITGVWGTMARPV